MCIYHDCAENFVAAKNPTCTYDGNVSYYFCKDCDKKFKSPGSFEEIGNYILPSTGHIEVIDESYPATFSEFGKTQGSHCAICGETIILQEDSYYYPDVSCDINNDNVVDAFEFVAMQKALLKIDDYKALFFDANFDGDFDIQDLIRITKLIEDR